MKITNIKEIEAKVRNCRYFDAGVLSPMHREDGIVYDKDPTNFYYFTNGHIDPADRIINRNRILRTEFRLNPLFFS